MGDLRSKSRCLHSGLYWLYRYGLNIWVHTMSK